MQLGHPLIQAALELQRHGDPAQAESLCRQAIGQDPENIDALRLLGLIVHQSGRHAEAVDLLRQALTRRAGHANTLNNLGEALRAMGSLDEAIECYRKAIGVDPNYPEPHNNLGVALVQAGQLAQAIGQFNRALKLRPNYVNAYVHLGDALLAAQQPSRAVEAFASALRLQPQHEAARAGLAAARGQIERSTVAQSAGEVVLRLGHSPDPDDAFMFYALAKGLIPTGPWRFEHVLQDIQTLNARARRGELEITAISIHAYPYVADRYALTSCGASMGDGYGPMVVAPRPLGLDDLAGRLIAIPGELTSAFLALQLAMGRGRPAAEASGGAAFRYVVVPFDQILQYVRDGQADAGLIIHEGQLTYAQLGLHLVVDLGAWWKERTGLPLPLGGNCIRKDLGPAAMQEVTDILKRSIQYSLDHRDEAVQYALAFGRDLDRPLADRFVGMYVNQWTLDYGQRGREAIRLFLARGAEAGLVPPVESLEFVTAAS
jgi:1,4-dihydroxy-6-naphthoate synthase